MKLTLAFILLTSTLSAEGYFSGRVTKKRTAHYYIQCDVSAAFTREVAMHLEAIYAEYYRRLRDFGGKIKERFNVHIYKKKEDYLKLVGPNLAGTAGIYISRKKLLAAYVGSMTYEQVLRTVYHEGFHQFTDAFLGGTRNMRPWISEGMAQLFEDATWNKRKFEIGEVPTFRLHVLDKVRKAGKWIRLRDLVEMDHRQWGANVRTDRMLAMAEYQESWSVVHFLVYASRGKYRKALINYLRYLNKGEAALVAFRKAFGTNMTGFESKWNAYVKSLKPSPKFQCRENLSLLGVMLDNAAGAQTVPADMSAYKVYIVNLFKTRGLTITPYGREPISSRSPKAVESLFRCPIHKNADKEQSYVLNMDANANNAAGRLKTASIQCLHHGNMTLSVRSVKDEGTGRYRPVVEETVGKKK